MAIRLKFKNKEIAEKLHEALIGSPAYIDSEIALVYDDTYNETNLVVGNDNKGDINIRVDSYNIVDE